MIYRLHRNVRWYVACLVLGIISNGMSSTCRAESVAKMSFAASPGGNMQFADGMFSLLNDGETSSPGDRNMSLDFLIDGDPSLAALAPAGKGSITLTGLMADASPTNTGTFIVQAFDAGNLAIYGQDGSLLLSADLLRSAIQGALGPSDAQALFLGFGDVTGGSLARLLVADSLQVRIKYPKISNGFSLETSPSPRLANFTTSTSTVEILAVRVPEPSLALTLSAVVWTLLPVRRRRGR